MTTYRGEADNAGAVGDGDQYAYGPITIAVDPNDNVTGSIKLGQPPTRGLTGFSGRMKSDGSFRAEGVNTVTNSGESSLDDVRMAVVLRGRRDGAGLSGTAEVTVNGVRQPTFSYALGTGIEGAATVALDDPKAHTAPGGTQLPGVPKVSGETVGRIARPIGILGLAVAGVYGAKKIWDRYKR